MEPTSILSDYNHNHVGWSHLRKGLAFLIGFFPPLSISGVDIAWVCFLALWLYDLTKKNTTFQFRSSPFDAVILAYIGAWVVAAIFGFSPLKSLSKLPHFHTSLLFFLLIWAYGGQLLPYALWGLMAGLGFNVIYGLSQYFVWQVIYDYNGGHRPNWIMALPDNKWKSYLTLSAAQGRIHGAVHALTYSELLIPPFLLSLVGILELKKKLIPGIVFVLSCAALTLAAERGPWLGALAGVAMIAVVRPQRWKPILLGLILVGLIFVNPDSRKRLVQMSHNARVGFSSVVTNDHRWRLWSGGLYIAKRHFLTGVGSGQIGTATEIYKKNPDFPPNPEGQETDLHNYYMQAFVEMGLPGLVVSLWLMGTFFWLGFCFYNKREILGEWAARYRMNMSVLSLGIWASFLAYAVINITERAYDDSEVSYVFWILAAVAYLPQMNHSDKNEPSYSGKTSSTALGLD